MSSVSDALAFRMADGELLEGARQYVSMTTRDVAADCLTRAGVSVRGLSTDETFTRAAQHTTSDFPLLVSNAMGKVALDAYRAVETPLKVLCRQRSLPNFKESTAIRLGGLGKLEELPESGEIVHVTRAERGETMRMKTFAGGITYSRNLQIDDDLGSLGDTTAAMGQAAAETEAAELVALIVDNLNLSDNVAVFHSSRGNIGTAGVPDVATLSAAREAMRMRVGSTASRWWMRARPTCWSRPIWKLKLNRFSPSSRRRRSARRTRSLARSSFWSSQVCRPARGISSPRPAGCRRFSMPTSRRALAFRFRGRKAGTCSA
jgi:hypothetical protein